MAVHMSVRMSIRMLSVTWSGNTGDDLEFGIPADEDVLTLRLIRRALLCPGQDRQHPVPLPCQHYLVPTQLSASTTECQRYLVPALLSASTT